LWGIVESVAIFIDEDSSLARRVILTVVAFVLGAFVAVTRAILATIPVVLGNVNIWSSGPATLPCTSESMTASVAGQIGFANTSSSGSPQNRLWPGE
jgi:hypothetical protein